MQADGKYQKVGEATGTEIVQAGVTVKPNSSGSQAVNSVKLDSADGDSPPMAQDGDGVSDIIGNFADFMVKNDSRLNKKFGEKIGRVVYHLKKVEKAQKKLSKQ